MHTMPNSITRSSNNYIHIPGSKNGKGRGVLAHREITQVLVAFSRSGDYHKVMLIKLLQGLTAGHDHQDNILQSANLNARKPRQFTIQLPGCMAQVAHHPNGNYYVTHIDSAPDVHREEDSTGLYEAIKRNDGWQTVFRDKPKPNPHGPTTIAITDATKLSNNAAIPGGKALSDSDYVAKITFNKFYLHHTHGTESITGYIKRKTITQPLNNKEIRSSSALLANAMMQARGESQNMPEKPEDRRAFAWVSSQGGSAVLTQALALLKQRGISFHGHNHHVFFHEIGSNTDQAVKLALDLGFKLPAKPFTKRLWSMTSLAVGGGHKAINHRVRAEEDYTRAMAGLDHTANVVIPSMGIVGAATLLTGSTLTGIALITAARKAYAAVSLADNIATDVAGERYDKLKKKVGLKR